MKKNLCPACKSNNVLIGEKWCICDDCGYRFITKKKVKKDKRLKLFISYGHTESEICQEIALHLISRGHDVWFDKENIKFGNDWREKLADGLLSSNGVIAFLSEYSVRDPGVCLNELSIAVAVRGGNIKTVLLDPEKKVNPPSTISHIQWLDMSDWREQKKNGAEKYNNWFISKMADLDEVIESDDSIMFSGQIAVIRSMLPLIVCDNSKQKSLLLQPYVGRKWLTEKIEEWLDDPNGDPLCILYGDPGIGKSAFAANYSHYNHKVIASIFCEYNRINFNKPESVIQTLAYLLSCKIPEYRTILADVLNSNFCIGEYTSSELFNVLLTYPLFECSFDGNHETVCIIIDGIDECGTYDKNALAEVFSNKANCLPPWLKILVTSRKVDSVKSVFTNISSIDLCGNNNDNIDDIRDFFALKLSDYITKHSCPENFIDMLTKNSGGIFLYAQIVSEAFIRNKLSPADIDKTPVGITEAFYCWFGNYFENSEYLTKYKLPVGVIASSPEPVPIEEFTDLFDWDENVTDDFFSRIRTLLRKDKTIEQKDTIEFSHKYLKDWVTGESAGIFRSSRMAAIRYMGKKYAKKALKDVETLTHYETLYLYVFLKESGQIDILNEINKTPSFYLKVNEVGDFYSERGKLSRAWQYYRTGQQIADYCKEMSDSCDVRLMCSISMLKLAEIFEAQGNLKSAAELYEECYEIRKKLCTERGNGNDKKCFGLSCERLAIIKRSLGNDKEAKALLLEGLEVREKLVKERKNPEDLRNLGSNYQFLAELYSKDGDFELAKKYFLLSLKIRREQIKVRGDLYDKKDLTVSIIQNAAFAHQIGDLAHSEILIDEACAMIKDLEKYSFNSEVFRAISYCYIYKGQLLAYKGAFDYARKYYEKAVYIRKKLIADRGSKEDYWTLGAAYIKLTLLDLTQKKYHECIDYFKKILEMDEGLVKERGKASDLEGVCVCHIGLAKCYIYLNNTDEAERSLSKAYDLAKKINDLYDTFDSRENLAFVFHLTSWLSLNKENYEDAIDNCKSALELRKYQVEKRGICDDYKYYGASCLLMATINRKNNNHSKAKKYYLKTIEIDEKNYFLGRGAATDLDCLFNAYIQYADFCAEIKELKIAQEYLAKTEQLYSLIKEKTEYGKFVDYASEMDSVQAKINMRGIINE